MQLTLWELENPLKPQIQAEFFKTVPTCPGVYRLLDEHKQILYIGKAKNLRVRVRYYRSKALMSSSRKLREMVRRVRSVEFETCDTEASALLKENELLAKIKPPYNVMNTRPEAYTYIGFRFHDKKLELKYSFELENFEEGFQIFGAFRGTGGSLRAFGALLRQIHFWLTPDKRWPLLLIRPKTPRYFAFECTDIERTQFIEMFLRAYFSGELSFCKEPRFPTLIDDLFHQNWWRLDLERIGWLQSSCAYLKSMRENFNVDGTVIEKTRINELAIQYSLKRQEQSKLEKLQNRISNALIETEQATQFTFQEPLRT